MVNKPENQDQNVLRRISNAVPLVSPQYAKIFSNPNSIGQVFAAAGNLLSPLQKDAIRNNLSTPDGNIPVDESICLTKTQLDQWDNDRRRLFDELPGDLAGEWVKKQNDKIKSDLIDMASLALDVTGPMQEAANKLMDPDTSDDCDISTSALSFSNDKLNQQSAEGAEGVFKSLTVNFQKDLIGGFWPWSYGVVDHILADRRGIPLRAHERRKNWTFLYPNWNNSQAEHDKRRDRLAEVLGSTLAEIILDVELQYDSPIKDYCGSCTACIDACPTNAILPTNIIDGSKCISYFTIELKGELLPKEYTKNFNDWIFGCDICQDVCPWNRFSTPHQEPLFAPDSRLLNYSKKEWKEITQDIFNEIFKKSAVKRTKFSGLKRNIEAISKK